MSSLGLLSRRAALWYRQDRDPAAVLGSLRKDSKALLGEHLWLYLVNDTNEFLEYFYGVKFWTPEERETVRLTLERRAEVLGRAGRPYYKFVVPEKQAVYPEYLPRALQRLLPFLGRPASIMAQDNPACFFYPLAYLQDAKSLGQLYFRGDSHPTWLGSFLFYQFIILQLRESYGPRITPAIRLCKMLPSMFGYNGDLYTQLHPDDLFLLKSAWSDVLEQGTFEKGVKYVLPIAEQQAVHAAPSAFLASLGLSRELIVKERPGSGLPRAVVFRDSTCEYMTDLLAEHFSRVVFVWHQGAVLGDVIEAEKPDIVLHIMAERFLRSYPQRKLIDRFVP